MPGSGLRELFEAAGTAEGRERQAILDGAAPELRCAVQELLDADRDAHAILDQPLVLPQPEAQHLPEATIVGRYRIVREIGSGGMGSVDLAELAENPTGPRFALKIVRFPSPELARRLVEETRILSRLDHPNIARLLDAGTTAEGLPFLAMEYVDGAPIHRFSQALPAPAIVQLVRQVCAAVRYLHQNLVIHRDLKPANILVTPSGTVKVVDFGIAKLLTPEVEGDTPTLGPLTPEYASPEQIQGGPLSTLTDVFTLGLVLYELLAGTKPFGGGSFEVLQKIAHQDAVRPSTHNPQIPADLDSIVLHAMEREPARRYASIEQLDEDLRRWQTGLPIAARGNSILYRTRKFVIRNKAAVAAGVAGVVLTGAGVIATEVQATRVEQERRNAQAQASVALAAQARAERSEADALRQRSDAERRLQQLEHLADGAVKALQASAEPTPGNAQSLADHVREVLLVLGREGISNGEQVRVFDNAEAELRSRQLASPGTWVVPEGWTTEGPQTEYRVGLDRNFRYEGKPSLFLKSLASEFTGNAQVFQVFSAERFRGKRIRLSSMIRSEKTESGWLRVVFDESLGAGTSVAGTTNWKAHEVVVDVPDDAHTIVIGVGMGGSGAMWAAKFDFRVVDRSTPTSQPTAPRNLGFTK